MAQNQNIPRRLWKIETTHRGVATHSLRTTVVGVRSLDNRLKPRLTDAFSALDVSSTFANWDNVDQFVLRFAAIVIFCASCHLNGN